MTNPQHESDDPFDILNPAAQADAESVGVDESEVVTSIVRRVEQASEAKVAHEMSWEANRLMLLGEQTVVRKLDSTDVMRAVDVNDGTRRVTVDNEILVTDRAFVSKMTRIVPGVSISPASADREDLLAAQVRESYLNYYSDRNDMRRVYKRAHEYFSAYGSAVFQNRWDHMGGRALMMCEACGYQSEHAEEEQDCPVCASEAAMAVEFGMDPGETPTLTKVNEGEPRTVLLDPRNFFPEPGVYDIKNNDGTVMNWCATKSAMHIADIRRAWPETGMKVGADDGLYDDRWLAYHGNLRQAELRTHWLEDHAIVYEYQAMPSGQHPKGILAYVCNDRLMHFGPNPYVELFGRLPFYIMRFFRIPQEFWGMPIISQQADLQKDLNRLLTQRRDHRAMTLLPRAIVEQGSGVSADDLTVRPGGVFTVRKGAQAPKYMETPNWPNSAIQEEEYYRNSIRMKAGVIGNDVGVTTGDPSGRFTALMAAQSAELVGPIVLENISEWLTLHRDVITMAQSWESPERRWLVTGQDSYSMHSWSMVASDRNGWDVQLDEVDIVNQNPVLRRQLATELLGLGFFNDNPEMPQMPNMRAFARFAGLKYPGAGVDLKSNEYTFAAQLPERLARGEQYMPQLEDDANVFAEELLNWLRGRGRRAPEALRQQVRELWLFYSQMMRPDMYAVQAQPNPGLVQAQAPAGPQPMQPPTGGGPGAPPSQGGQGGQGGLPTAQQGPNQIIGHADATAERAARGNRPHEG